MIYHVYSHYESRNPQTQRRMRLARSTWSKQSWQEIPVQDRQVRCYTDHKGEVPYVKDVINVGARDRKDEDVLVFTNADICVSSDCAFKIVMALQSIDAVYCFRRDFPKLEQILPDPIINKGTQYCGSDLYGFRVGWWRRWSKDFPDMLLGREGWDAVLRILIEQTNPKRNPTLHNLIYHERHGSVWENPANRRTIPSQMHNVHLGRQFCHSWGFDPRRIGL